MLICGAAGGQGQAGEDVCVFKLCRGVTVACYPTCTAGYRIRLGLGKGIWQGCWLGGANTLGAWIVTQQPVQCVNL